MIVAQVGQCGIQIGNYIQTLLDDGDAQLVVDTERKVWRKHLSLYKDQTVYKDLGTGGRGNNWACGYSDPMDVMESFRKACEITPSNSMLLVHSLGGGTGSGLGSRLAVEIRDDYPKMTIATCSVLPLATGETCLQNYNAVLSLASLSRNVDIIGLVANTLLDGPLSDMNRYISECLRDMLVSKYLQDLIVNVTPNPQMAIAQFAHTSGVQSWQDATSLLTRKIFSIESHKPRCFGAVLRTRGPKILPALKLDRISKRLGQCGNIELRASVCTEQHLNICYNSTTSAYMIEPIVQICEQQYLHKAYLHWYTRYVDESVIGDAIEDLHSIVTDYYQS